MRVSVLSKATNAMSSFVQGGREDREVLPNYPRRQALFEEGRNSSVAVSNQLYPTTQRATTP